MLNPIDPQSQYIIYKHREKELELDIQRRLTREARAAASPVPQAIPWYTAVAEWLSAIVPFHAIQKQVAAQPARIEEPHPCQGLPC